MKRFFLIILSCLLMVTFSLASYQDDCGALLVKMNLLSGYPDGTLKLENNITRAEFSVLVMKMIGFTNDNITLDMEKEFSDLKEKHWAYKSVLKANELGYLSGYEDNTFRPSNNLTYAESCSIMVSLLGYKDELSGSWPNNVINKATELGVNKKLKNKTSKDLMTRGEVSVMIINALEVEIKK